MTQKKERFNNTILPIIDELNAFAIQPQAAKITLENIDDTSHEESQQPLNVAIKQVAEQLERTVSFEDLHSQELQTAIETSLRLLSNMNSLLFEKIEDREDAAEDAAVALDVDENVDLLSKNEQRIKAEVNYLDLHNNGEYSFFKNLEDIQERIEDAADMLGLNTQLPSKAVQVPTQYAELVDCIQNPHTEALLEGIEGIDGAPKPLVAMRQAIGNGSPNLGMVSDQIEICLGAVKQHSPAADLLVGMKHLLRECNHL